jgi:EF hand
MRRPQLLLMPAVLAVLILAGTDVAQAPDQKQEPPWELARAAPLSVDDVVERLMAFDQNRDGKVTRDELPERMQFLIELGDTNKDGALDRDEIKQLVAAKLAAARATTPGGFGGRGELRGGFGGGFGGGGFAVGGGIRGGGPGPGPGPGAIEGVVDDLKLSGQKKDRAMAAVKAHQENVSRLMEQARAELLQKMKEILSAEELEDFKAALDRPRGGTTIINVGPPDAPRPGRP